LTLRWLKGRGRRIDTSHRRNESISAPRDRLDELRAPGIVAERLAQLGDRLSQCVLGDVCVRPQRIEQLLFRDQLAGIVEQMEQEVEELWRQLDDGVVSKNAIASTIGEERSELIAGACHARYTTSSSSTRSGLC
jgi:hypothetical protein